LKVLGKYDTKTLKSIINQLKYLVMEKVIICGMCIASAIAFLVFLFEFLRSIIGNGKLFHFTKFSNIMCLLVIIWVIAVIPLSLQIEMPERINVILAGMLPPFGGAFAGMFLSAPIGSFFVN